MFAQTQFDPEFETATSAYTLVSASLGTSLKLRKQSLKLFISANNLFDKEYVDHLNRLKYVGILNQGRNISFGMQVPLDIK